MAESKFVWKDASDLFYPTPTKRIENPHPAIFNPGDIVRSKIGPSRGQLGVVVVERNDNYIDSQDSCLPEDIGVKFAEANITLEDLGELVKTIIDGEIPTIRTVTRWFSDPDELETVASFTSLMENE